MIQLNYRDTRPFYQQIKDNVRQLVVSGALKKDEKLPSVRDMAASLAINPNTIQRAYRELESEGYIYTLSGIHQMSQLQVKTIRAMYPGNCCHSLIRSCLSFSTCPCR